ncbi:MAG: hypothetical protein KAI70_06460 [Candidatus Omnitrophica bacterium]|nr:hypothetical protein [Candidatus Omnitrophota bacterium]
MLMFDRKELLTLGFCNNYDKESRSIVTSGGYCREKDENVFDGPCGKGVE